MRDPFPFRLAAVLLALAGAACSDGSGPAEDDLTGKDYPLYEVGLSPLPVLDKTTTFGAQLYITGGTLRVINEDTVLFVTQAEYRSAFNPNDVTAVSPESLRAAYTRSGDRLLVPFASGPNGAYTDTIAIMNGFLRASRFRAHREGTYQRRDYIYLTR